MIEQKNVAVCSFTIYFRITPLFYLDLVAFSLFSIAHNVKAAIYGQKLHTKKARTKRIFFVNAKKLAKTKQIKRICFRFLLRNLIMTLIILYAVLNKYEYFSFCG